MRKTFDLKPTVEFANRLLQNPYNGTYDQGVAFREGVIRMIEEALVSSGSYRGFSYLSNYELPAGVKPGVNYVDRDGVCVPHPNYDQRFVNTDSTRRQYHYR